MRSMRNSFRSVFLLCLLMLLLTGCRLTDHSEKDPDAITADGLNFPKSGFENVDPAELPKVEFEETHLDLGEIVQGAKVERTFTFENTGGSALVISDVRGSCGCTIAKDWPKEPVKPGASGTISFTFDSEGRNGRQDKTITMVANTSPPSTVLTFSAEVIGPVVKP
ncbi:MAG: DUF1573 domain-containing protein [Flavobacteriales bacterium]|nr:DUF1573 domain-containing protein [Flavobacteriales bacterium]